MAVDDDRSVGGPAPSAADPVQRGATR